MTTPSDMDIRIELLVTLDPDAMRAYRQRIRHEAYLGAAETIDTQAPKAAEQLRTAALLIEAGSLLVETGHPDAAVA